MKQLCKRCKSEAVIKVTYSEVDGVTYDKNDKYNAKYYNDKFGGYFCEKHQ
jgi:hypothetical protein